MVCNPQASVSNFVPCHGGGVVHHPAHAPCRAHKHRFIQLAGHIKVFQARLVVSTTALLPRKYCSIRLGRTPELLLEEGAGLFTHNLPSSSGGCCAVVVNKDYSYVT